MAELRLGFDRRLKLKFHGSRVTSDAGLLAFCELDDALGLTDLAGQVLTDSRSGKNSRHTVEAEFRQSVFGRIAGYEDVNDADRLGQPDRRASKTGAYPMFMTRPAPRDQPTGQVRLNSSKTVYLHLRHRNAFRGAKTERVRGYYLASGLPGTSVWPYLAAIRTQVRRSYGKYRMSFESVVTRFLDLTLSLLLMLFLLPAFLLISLVTRLTDKGPVFFTQNRVGFAGRTFRCHKFRSMKLNSDHLLKTHLENNPDEYENYRIYRKIRRDPRVTPFGNLLRKASLDEVPQIFNVLKGEMSLVGPRPITTDEIGKYGRSLRLYKTVRPGITGLWQVKGRNEVSYRRRIALDRVYVRKRSVGLYFYILLVTIPAVLLQRGSR